MNIAQVPAFNKSLPVLPESLQIKAKKLLGIPQSESVRVFQTDYRISSPGRASATSPRQPGHEGTSSADSEVTAIQLARFSLTTDHGRQILSSHPLFVTDNCVVVVKACGVVLVSV
jgi:hypothetical protein